MPRSTNHRYSLLENRLHKLLRLVSREQLQPDNVLRNFNDAGQILEPVPYRTNAHGRVSVYR